MKVRSLFTGFELDIFVHPDRISSQLICTICQGVLDRPVQTPSEHLFCEDELLEWMTRSNLCPITHRVLDPNSIRKPSRIILNMLGELERFCQHKSRGCSWQGQSERVAEHEKNCSWRPIEDLLLQISKRDEFIRVLQRDFTALEKRNEELEISNQSLHEKVSVLTKRLKVYEALVVQDEEKYNHTEKRLNVQDFGCAEEKEDNQCPLTDLQRIARLRRFHAQIEHTESR